MQEQHLGLFANRPSSMRWWTNQMRMLLSALAYVLLDYVRGVGLARTVRA
jgi:hypothetical protein